VKVGVAGGLLLPIPYAPPVSAAKLADPYATGLEIGLVRALFKVLDTAGAAGLDTGALLIGAGVVFGITKGFGATTAGFLKSELTFLPIALVIDIFIDL
jgi:hypothetical protein